MLPNTRQFWGAAKVILNWGNRDGQIYRKNNLQVWSTMRALVLLFFLIPFVDLSGAKPPEVVLLGDSIRIGYQAAVINSLEGTARVWAPKENCRHSAFLLERIEGWLEDRSPRVIHLNVGLHDMYVDRKTGKPRHSLETYEKNLRAIFSKIKEVSDAKIVFALTTPVNEESQARSETYQRVVRRSADVQLYNNKAREVARQAGVIVNDLHGFITKAGKEDILRPSDGIHLSPDGSKLVGDAIANFIQEQLSTAKERPPSKKAP